MFAIGMPPGKTLPFGTVVVQTVTFNHTHRDRAGFTWVEPITLDIHMLGLLPVVTRPCNDNEEAA
ncbi:hypothetical protein QA639_21250 [Bradyrhizobium pachyrhizi]|uniref:hypothetical protein n=1 Tax=Bradyrhizobium pachyrhizi TaxID=280333 RepID=UPI0024B235CE|nr:hypothetical protein [Bradyrhizobium pachyrhizi]WFU52237.1 hypothetical protein QA639_21250 [Bradyrhizobium pachyrhizi]